MALSQPTTEHGRSGLRRVLEHPDRTLLATDFDGTLAPIVDDPAAATVHADATRVLGALAGRFAGVAIVTGRPVADVLRLGRFEGAAGLGALRVLGQYGVEQWDARTGELVAPDPHPGVAQARRALPDVLQRLGLGAAHLEDKGRALGVHVRRLPDPDAALEALRAPVAALADEHGLVVEPGKQVLELRAPGVDKGAALNLLLGDDDIGAVVDTVIYAGDDLGDLAAYDAVDRLRAEGGAGLMICVTGDARTPLEQRADVLVEGPQGFVGWLAELDAQLVAPPAGNA
jgi:trehalose 6-phosphate phosphatase